MPKVDRKEKGAWMRPRCYACGHVLRFAANGCPQCGEMFDGRPDPKTWPATCACDRCSVQHGKKPEEVLAELISDGEDVAIERLPRHDMKIKGRP